MTCREVDVLLDDYVGGELAPAERTRVREHLKTCAACREAEARLRDLIARARALPESVEPGRDLWFGIEDALDADPEARSGAGQAAFAGGGWRRTALAAAALMLLAGMGLILRASRTAPAPGAHEGSSPVSMVRVPQIPAREGFGPAGIAFYEVRKSLRRAIERNGTTFSPRTAETVNANLEIIDGAIRQIHSALARDPADRRLGRMLIATQRREVALLTRVAQTAAVR